MNLKAVGSGIDAEGFLLFHLCTRMLLSFSFGFLMPDPSRTPSSQSPVREFASLVRNGFLKNPSYNILVLLT